MDTLDLAVIGAGAAGTWVADAGLHPYAEIPEPAGSAFMHWGSDPREIGWCYWLAGHNPDEVMPVAIQPEPSLPIFICGESFSRAQAWVEGALETAEAAVARLLS